jgi:transposase InsO family protein
MVRELRARGFPAGRERVERLMRENGIRARHKRRYKVTTETLKSPTRSTVAHF